MQRLQGVIYAAAAKCEQSSGSARLGSAGSVGHGRFFSLYMGRPYGHPADPCQTMPHGAKLADYAAPCDNLPSVPVFGTVPTGAL